MIDPRLSHYRIIDQIDSGGMGVVYLAHDEHLDRNVAIKILSPGLLSDAAARKRFRKEALSLARLNHPNIATVHEFGTQNGSDFLVTEYIAGTNLDALITSGPVSSDEILRLGIQLAEGLGAAHQRPAPRTGPRPAHEAGRAVQEQEDQRRHPPLHRPHARPAGRPARRTPARLTPPG